MNCLTLCGNGGRLAWVVMCASIASGCSARYRTTPQDDRRGELVPACGGEEQVDPLDRLADRPLDRFPEGRWWLRRRWAVEVELRLWRRFDDRDGLWSGWRIRNWLWMLRRVRLWIWLRIRVLWRRRGQALLGGRLRRLRNGWRAGRVREDRHTRWRRIGRLDLRSQLRGGCGRRKVLVLVVLVVRRRLCGWRFKDIAHALPSLHVSPTRHAGSRNLYGDQRAGAG
jgi:hypothetical protein